MDPENEMSMVPDVTQRDPRRDAEEVYRKVFAKDPSFKNESPETVISMIEQRMRAKQENARMDKAFREGGQSTNEQFDAAKEERKRIARINAESAQREIDYQKDDSFWSNDTAVGILSGLGGGGMGMPTGGVESLKAADNEGFTPGLMGVFNVATQPSTWFNKDARNETYMQGRDTFREDVREAKENPNFYAGQGAGGFGGMLGVAGKAGMAVKSIGQWLRAGAAAMPFGAVAGALSGGEEGKIAPVSETLLDAGIGAGVSGLAGTVLGGASAMNSAARKAGHNEFFNVIPYLADETADFIDKGSKRVTSDFFRRIAGNKHNSTDDVFLPTRPQTFEEQDAYRKSLIPKEKADKKAKVQAQKKGIITYDDLSSSTAAIEPTARPQPRKGNYQPNVKFETKESPNLDDVFLQRGLLDELDTPQQSMAPRGEIEPAPPIQSKMSPTDEIARVERMTNQRARPPQKPESPFLIDRQEQFGHTGYFDDEGNAFWASSEKARPSPERGDFLIPANEESPFLMGSDKFSGSYQDIAPNLEAGAKSWSKPGYTNPFDDVGNTPPRELYSKPIGPEQPTFKQLEQYDNAVKRRSALEMQQNPSPSEEVVAKANALKDELTAIRAAGGPKPSQRMSARDAMNLDEPPIPTRGVEKTNAGRRGGPTPQKPNPDIDKSFAEASEIIKNKPVDEIPAAPKPEPPKPKQHGGDRSRFADQVRPEGVKIKDQHYVKPPKSKSNEFVDFFDGDGQYIGNFEVPKGLDDAGKKAILKRWAEGIKKGKGYDPLDGEDLANITFTPGGKMTTKHQAAMSTFKKKDK